MQPETRQLCDELLGMAERERAALGAGNLDELERCLARKSHVLDELTSMGSRTEQYALLAGELFEVLEQVRNAHNEVRDGVRNMLGACEEEIVGIERGRKAHRAYHRSRTSGTGPGGRKAGSRRGGLRERRRVL
ncbi:MAG: hypothetical protein H6Q55_2962 [Deltaproteobacteria bacterium]|nr:hypothetical protein [Deltaproteobacteria bacterium]